MPNGTREDGYVVPRDCYNSYFYVVEDESLNIDGQVPTARPQIHRAPHGRLGPAHEPRRNTFRARSSTATCCAWLPQEGCNYFTFNIPNTVCNDCGHIDKRNLKACPEMPRQESRLSDPHHRLYEACQQLLSSSAAGGRASSLCYAWPALMWCSRRFRAK